MSRIVASQTFMTWIDSLKDRRAAALIASRIDRLGLGHNGDAKFVGGGVHELRIHSGPGYRVYFARRGTEVVVLLAGGSKSTQQRDITKAKAVLKEYAS